MRVQFLFNNFDMKLAIIFCLEHMKTDDIFSVNELWLELKKVVKHPSFTKFIYLVDKLKKENLYELKNDLIEIKKDKSFYNKMINLLLKNNEQITYKFPFTDELYDDIINKYNVDLNRLLTLLESNKIKVSLRRIKSKNKKRQIKTFYLKQKLFELDENNKRLTINVKELTSYKKKYYLVGFLFSILFTFTFLPIFYFFVSVY